MIKRLSLRAADGRLVVETTMRADEVVVVVPGSESEVALVGVVPVSDVGPLAQSGLDEAFGFAVGLRRVRTSASMFESECVAGLAKVMGAIAAAVVGEQSADGDAMASKKVNGSLEKGDGGASLLVGEDLGEGQTRVVVDGHVRSEEHTPELQ